MAEEMLREIHRLPADLATLPAELAGELTAAVPVRVLADIQRVVVVGDGDSHHAALATTLAFRTFAGLDATPTTALPLLRYGADRLRRHAAGTTLVIGVSASGATPRVVAALHAARAAGARTLAVSGAPDSPISQVADGAVWYRLPGKEASPGIRTYQASLLALLTAAIHLGGARGTADVPGLTSELAAAAAVVDATSAALAATEGPALDLIAAAGALITLGSGPGHGTALYAAAKFIEAAGLLAWGQETDQWWHVERFASSASPPLVFVAPPGRAEQEVAELVRRASDLGRSVCVVVDPAHRSLTEHATVVLPVVGHVREEFSPLAYHLFAGRLAARVAQAMGRRPFQVHAARRPENP
ncbi:SIS domain-containing protein [Longispora urticae]